MYCKRGADGLVFICGELFEGVAAVGDNGGGDSAGLQRDISRLQNLNTKPQGSQRNTQSSQGLDSLCALCIPLCT